MTAIPTRTDRFVKKLASLVVFAAYQSVDIYEPEHHASGGPQLTVANHFGGVADALLLVHAMPTMPRIIARDGIWKFPIVGWLLNGVGAIPVHKPEDHIGEDDPNRNDQMFASAYGALEDGEHLMIFPEGITRDDPSIAPIKTGAARIALGARSAGAEGIQVTPAGIHYEDKAALRSRVSIQIGAALDLDREIGRYTGPGDGAGPDNREAVRNLTTDIEGRIRGVAPDFRDWNEARTLTGGAELLLRSLADSPNDDMSIAERDVLAGHLGRTSAEVKHRIVGEVDAYQRQLDDLGVDDARLLAGVSTGRLARRLLGWLVLSIVLLPFAIAGVLINWLPYLVVKATGLLRVAPAVFATIKPLVATVAFGIAWGVTIWSTLRAFDAQAAALVAIMLPFYLGAVIVVSERFVLLWRSFRAWRRRGAARKYGEELMASRNRVLATLVEAS